MGFKSNEKEKINIEQGDEMVNKKIGRPKGKGRYYKVTGVVDGKKYVLGYTSSKTAFTKHSDWKPSQLRFKVMYKK